MLLWDGVKSMTSLQPKLRIFLRWNNFIAVSSSKRVTWQYKSYSSNENENSGEEKATNGTEEKNKQSEASKKLTSLLSNIKIEESFLKERKSSINLAKPGGAKMLKKLTYNKHIEKLQPDIEDSKIMEEQLKAAVSEVAESLGGDSKKTESELLQKLKGHSIIAKDDDKELSNFSDIFVGMKIDRNKKATRTSEFSAPYDPSFQSSNNWRKLYQPRDEQKQRERKFRSPPTEIYEEINLYGSKPLGFFKTGAIKEEKTKTVWERLEEEELQLLVTHPPMNAFEEMIRWTDEGKFWQFPINNEFGLDEEAATGFEEHVFLEHLLEGFPLQGHIRHFMELVVVGLSKNPYISVERKKENIEWFRQYFKEKDALLKEIGVVDRMEASSSLEKEPV